MELFAFGTLAGLVIFMLANLISNVIFGVNDNLRKGGEENWDPEETEIDDLLEGLYTMKVATGLCSEEKKIIDNAINYIEKTKGS